MSWRTEGWNENKREHVRMNPINAVVAYEAGADAGIKALVEWIEENKLIPNEQCYAVPTEEHKRSCKVCKWQALRKEVGLKN